MRYKSQVALTRNRRNYSWRALWTKGAPSSRETSCRCMQSGRRQLTQDQLSPSPLLQASRPRLRHRRRLNSNQLQQAAGKLTVPHIRGAMPCHLPMPEHHVFLLVVHSCAGLLNVRCQKEHSLATCGECFRGCTFVAIQRTPEKMWLSSQSV